MREGERERERERERELVPRSCCRPAAEPESVRCVALMAPIMQQRAPLMGRLHGESAEEKKKLLQSEAFGSKNKPPTPPPPPKKRKSDLETGGRRASWEFFLS